MTPNWYQVFVLFVRWTPMVLMYMMDTEIWYLMWVSVYGTVRGWMLHIGEVPDFNQVPRRQQQ